MLRQICLVLLLLSITLTHLDSNYAVHAADYTAVQSGNWDDTATWGGTIPTSADNVSIPSGFTVTIPNAVTVNRDAGTTLNIFGGGTLTNNGTLNNAGTLDNNGTATLNNTGTLTTQSGSTFISYGTFNNDSGATFSNNGTFDSHGAIVNNATINNNGILNTYSDGGGTLDNYSLFNNYGTFTIHGGSTVNNNGSSTLTNYNGAVFNVYANGTLNNNANLNNNGTINHGGLLANNGILNNNGTFYMACFGVITGNAINGNPVIYPFQRVPPNLINPVHRTHTTDTTPSFSWSSVSGALSYRLMVYTEDRSFEFKKRRVGETSTSYTLTAAEALAPQKYLWRVRTQDACDTWTTWSGRNTLFVD